MEQKRITVVIDAIGRSTVEAHGFTGGACTDATKAIEQALAGGPGGVTRVFKPEWQAYDDTSNQEQERQSW